MEIDTIMMKTAQKISTNSKRKNRRIVIGLLVLVTVVMSLTLEIHDILGDLGLFSINEKRLPNWVINFSFFGAYSQAFCVFWLFIIHLILEIRILIREKEQTLFNNFIKNKWVLMSWLPYIAYIISFVY